MNKLRIGSHVLAALVFGGALLAAAVVQAHGGGHRHAVHADTVVYAPPAE